MTPYVGIIISLVAFGIGTWLFKKYDGFFLFSPLFVAMILGVLILQVTNISYDDYSEGGNVISFFLEPATIAFAIPLYKKRDLLKEYWKEITTIITIGSIVSVFSVGIIGAFINMQSAITISLLPQAATTAISVPVSVGAGGISSLTAFSVIFNGVIVFALGNRILKWFKVEDPIVKGLALGSAGHSLGVLVALEMGETEAAMASVAVVIIGLITVFVVPMAIPLLGL